jgi:hypothetical protein
MRLFKFLVISDEVMKESEMVKPVVRVRDGANTAINSKNTFYFYCQDLHKIKIKLLRSMIYQIVKKALY